jgi:DNA (cytosine-5)-methyltransferase 1
MRGQRKLKTIDLFCGAGGLTQGFLQAGFACLYSNDAMAEAIETFKHNHPETWADCGNIEEVSPNEVREKLGIQVGELDVLVGGPPCQGFSINAPDRFLTDPRNKLFKDYVRFLKEFKPSTFVFENVPGLLSLGNGKVFDQIVGELSSHGYQVNYRILFAAHYGVPQERWRLIIVGSRLGEVHLPAPTHFARGRANFRGGRTLTHQLDDVRGKSLKPFVSVGEAIGDLPRLQMGEGEELVRYTSTVASPYACSMRNSKGFTFNHYAARLAKQNIERMKFIGPGGSWRDIPHDLLPAGMKLARKSDHTKRYGRLTTDGLAGTVMTKCDPHWGAVFLPDQDRALTVREAARLQSFPDSYEFKGSRVSQYVQVGNAVPVLMAKAIARSIRAHFDEVVVPLTKIAVNG